MRHGAKCFFLSNLLAAALLVAGAHAQTNPGEGAGEEADSPFAAAAPGEEESPFASAESAVTETPEVEDPFARPPDFEPEDPFADTTVEDPFIADTAETEISSPFDEETTQPAPAEPSDSDLGFQIPTEPIEEIAAERSLSVPPRPVEEVNYVDLQFHDSINQGVTAASASGKPVLVLFSGDRRSAQQFERLLSREEVARQLAGFELVRINYLDNRDVASEYAVRSFPYLVVLNRLGYTIGHVLPMDNAELLIGTLSPFTQKFYE